MMKILRFFGKLIGAVLVLVFIFSMFSSIFLLAFTTQLFNPEFYLEVLEEEEFFDQLPEIAATQIRYSMTFNPCLEDPDMCKEDDSSDENGEGGPPSYFQALSEEDWETLLAELLPEDWLENQIYDLVHNTIDSIRSGSEELPLKISLLELKDHLTGQAGVEAIRGVMASQPECSKDDLLEMARVLEGSEESGMDLLTCYPGDEFLDNYAPQIEVFLNKSLQDIPDEINFAEGLEGKEISIAPLGIDLPLPSLINFLRWTILISPLLNLLLLLVIAALAVHSFQALRVWWGYPIAIAGLLAVALSSLASPVADLLADKFLQDPPMAGLHESLVDAASGIALEILRLLVTQARNYALIVTGVGVTVIVLASVLNVSTKPREFKPSGEYGDSGESLPDDAFGETPVLENLPETEEKEKKRLLFFKRRRGSGAPSAHTEDGKS